MIQNVNLVNRINNCPWKVFMAITGGGQTFIGDYLSISGGSRIIYGAFVPYSKMAFDTFVKVPVDNYASSEAARKLAVASFHELLRYGVRRKDALGLGVASSLAKDNEREGREHRIHVAIHRYDITEEHSLLLKQGRTRLQEEEIAKDFIFQCFAHGTQAVLRMPAFMWLDEEKGEKYDSLSEGNPRYIQLINGTSQALFSNFDPYQESSLVVYPGSWNPMHEAHKAIYALAQTITNSKPVLEMTIANADKGQMDYIEIAKRCRALDPQPYVLTTAPTFVAKTLLFAKYKKPIIFVVGADTWARVWDPKYAGPPEEVKKVFEQNDVKFLVFGRGDTPIYQGIGESLRIHDLRASTFDFSMSSSELRKR